MLSWMLPGLIGTLLILDILFRFLPLEPLCFRAWECMARYPEPGGMFEANKQFYGERTYGNLANMGNLPYKRQYRPQVFTTDRFGYRNVQDGWRSQRGVVLLGDSFVVGDGVSDQDTLSVQLTRATGIPVYNAGGPYAYFGTLRSLKHKLGVKGGLAVVVQTENVPVVMLEEAEARRRHPDVPQQLLERAVGEDADRLWSRLRGWWNTSPLRILAQKAYRSLSDGRILPNPDARRVVEGRLRNGEAMLFYPPDMLAFHQRRSVEEAADYFVRLAADFRQEGFGLAVVLVPSKYAVYFPFLADPKPEPGDPVHPHARLEGLLQTKGVPVLDLTPTFRARAAQDVATGEYMFWLDDTHWNPRGIELAVVQIRKRWFESSLPEISNREGTPSQDSMRDASQKGVFARD